MLILIIFVSLISFICGAQYAKYQAIEAMQGLMRLFFAKLKETETVDIDLIQKKFGEASTDYLDLMDGKIDKQA